MRYLRGCDREKTYGSRLCNDHRWPHAYHHYKKEPISVLEVQVQGLKKTNKVAKICSDTPARSSVGADVVPHADVPLGMYGTACPTCTTVGGAAWVTEERPIARAREVNKVGLENITIE